MDQWTLYEVLSFSFWSKRFTINFLNTYQINAEKGKQYHFFPFIVYFMIFFENLIHLIGNSKKIGIWNLNNKNDFVILFWFKTTSFSMNLTHLALPGFYLNSKDFKSLLNFKLYYINIDQKVHVEWSQLFFGFWIYCI